MKERGGQLTVDHVLDPTVAVVQRLLPLSPARALGLELDQEVALLACLVAFLLLGTQRRLGVAQLLLQGGIGFCKNKKEKKINKSTRRKVVTGRSGPTAQQSARISGTTPSGCADVPPQEKKEKLTPTVGKVGSPLGQIPDFGVEGGRADVL